MTSAPVLLFFLATVVACVVLLQNILSSGTPLNTHYKSETTHQHDKRIPAKIVTVLDNDTSSTATSSMPLAEITTETSLGPSDDATTTDSAFIISSSSSFAEPTTASRDCPLIANFAPSEISYQSLGDCGTPQDLVACLRDCQATTGCNTMGYRAIGDTWFLADKARLADIAPYIDYTNDTYLMYDLTCWDLSSVDWSSLMTQAESTEASADATPVLAASANRLATRSGANSTSSLPPSSSAKPTCNPSNISCGGSANITYIEQSEYYLASPLVDEHTSCQQHCLKTPNCESITTDFSTACHLFSNQYLEEQNPGSHCGESDTCTLSWIAKGFFGFQCFSPTYTYPLTLPIDGRSVCGL